MTVNRLDPDAFADFFRALHAGRDRSGTIVPGRSPYSWQRRLAVLAAEGRWPTAIDLPTGSGKTACLDAAIFALACQAQLPPGGRTAPRRLFFCVNRRVIVDEAHARATRIARRLAEAEQGLWPQLPILQEVASALRSLAGTKGREQEVPPLDVLELRGGIFRDNRWARSAAQPTVVCTTIDQLGSRLLFRGYGVSSAAAPIQAALIAYDSLVLLDEAHISQPFIQTLAHVGRYLDPERWAEVAIGPRPMTVVPMTATPPQGVGDGGVLGLDAEDRRALGGRLGARKPATLRLVPDVSRALADHAIAADEAGPVAVGILVNRVDTARQIYRALKDARGKDADVVLVIGAMRPIDRDAQSRRLSASLGPDRPTPAERTTFVVATQCLEVGADYDFDVLLTECAALDALRQRFGRLNRAGRGIEARALIVAKDKDVQDIEKLDDEKPRDPIYGNALALTWKWLWDHAREVAAQVDEAVPEGRKAGRKKARGAAAEATARVIDFGIDAFEVLLEEDGEGGRIPDVLLAPSVHEKAPVLLPAYLDLWCQTAPVPALDPDVALFLHGPRRGQPDVQVCWRADLLNDQEAGSRSWPDVLALVPPASAECMTVPLARLRQWLAGKESKTPDSGDLLEASEIGDEMEPGAGVAAGRVAVLWRGAEGSRVVQSSADLGLIRPGDTIVLPLRAGGWDALGHIHQADPMNSGEEASGSVAFALGIDAAEPAFRQARDRLVLRLHPALFSGKLGERLARAADPDAEISDSELRELIEEAARLPGPADPPVEEAAHLPESDPRRGLFLDFADPSRKFLRKPYPDGKGLVLIARDRLEEGRSWFLPAIDEGEDDASRIGRDEPVTLADHNVHVQGEMGRNLGCLATTVPATIYASAIGRHDWGKADDRFQALLRGSSRTDAWLRSGAAAEMLAKSDGVPQSRAERRAARERAGLPAGFRHEMLSVQIAGREGLPDVPEEWRDLVLHLIAAHHGHARPFAPVVIDEAPPAVEIGGVALAPGERLELPPHRLDSGVAERFWRLTRRYGWWGLAYLEALLRLADQQASADEDAGVSVRMQNSPSDSEHAR